jgi:hypothetical protein
MPEGEWSWPVNPMRYDRRGRLRKKEATALDYLVSRELYGHFRGRVRDDLARLTQPILDVVAALARRSSLAMARSERWFSRCTGGRHRFGYGPVRSG